MKIGKEELKVLNPYISIIEKQGFTWDELGRQLDLEQQGFGAKASASNDRSYFKRPPMDFWSALKKELRILICTDDEKYEELRKKINENKTSVTAFTVSTISATLAPIVGTTVAALSPLVGIALYAMIILGKNTWCESLHPIKS